MRPTPARRSRVAAFTLIELVISASVLSIAMLCLSPLLKSPLQIQNAISQADQERLISSAMDVLVNDLVEADPSSINWPTIYPNASADINTLSLVKTTYVGSANPQVNTIVYSFIPDASSGLGSIRRARNGFRTTLLRNILAPTPAAPLAQVDPTTNNILILTLRFRGTGVTPASAVRRVGIKGNGYAP